MKWALSIGFAAVLAVVAYMSHQEGYKSGALAASNAALEQHLALLRSAREQYQASLSAATQEAKRLRAEAAQREVHYEQSSQAYEQQITRLKAHNECLAWRLPAELMHPLANARAAAASAAAGTAHAAMPATTHAASNNGGE